MQILLKPFYPSSPWNVSGLQQCWKHFQTDWLEGQVSTPAVYVLPVVDGYLWLKGQVSTPVVHMFDLLKMVISDSKGRWVPLLGSSCRLLLSSRCCQPSLWRTKQIYIFIFCHQQLKNTIFGKQQKTIIFFLIFRMFTGSLMFKMMG